MTNIFVINDLIKEKVEVLNNGQTIVYYKSQPWRFGKACTIDYLILCGYTWEELDQNTRDCLAPMLRNPFLTPNMDARIIEI